MAIRGRPSSIKAIVGIDVGSELLQAAVRRSLTERRKSETSVSNTKEGVGRLVSWLRRRRLTSANAVVCLESCGVYGEVVCYALSDRGFRLAVEPPLKVKRALHRHRHKNDSLDARAIAEYGLRFYDDLHWWTPPSECVEHLRSILQTREHCIQERSAFKRTLKATQRHVHIAPVALDTQRRIVMMFTEMIHRLDVGLRDVIALDGRLEERYGSLTTIPGVGPILAADLLAVTRGFSRPENYRHLASYLGISPVEHRSGTSVHRHARSRGFGPRRLRKVLYLSSMAVARQHPDFAPYYRRKIAEGKPRRLVLNNISNKLLKISCAVARGDVSYRSAASSPRA